ncbi:pseudouridine synthase [Xylophilus sp. Kf1]|nr:pseudouridine synthase [Xylophilus sp. Kf1]
MARPLPAWSPPLRDGVGASRVSVQAGPFATVLPFLQARFPRIHDWPERLAGDQVHDTHGRAVRADTPCARGMVLWYWRSPPAEHPVPFDIALLHRDEHLVVVDKPHFLSTQPGGRHLHETVLVRLKRLLGIDTLVPMHRLDRDTAGVLAFVVRPADRHAYHSLLRDRQVHKVYEAIAPWNAALALPLVYRSRLEEPEGHNFMQMQVVPGEPNAETRVELIGRLAGTDEPGLAHYRLTPRTGRKHQLRAHMSALGLPIVGDRVYPHLLPLPPDGAEPDYSQPLQLLSREFGFVDPLSGETRNFVSRRRLALTPAPGPVPAPAAGRSP